MSVFTNNLKKLIEEHGTTYASLSREIGISKNGLKYWETAGNIPNTKILVKLADYFGTSVEYLIGQTDDPEKPKVALKGTSDKNILRLAGRDGKHQERILSDEQMEILRKLVAQLPEAPEDL